VATTHTNIRASRRRVLEVLRILIIFAGSRYAVAT
jgi:hypothetical protein